MGTEGALEQAQFPPAWNYRDLDGASLTQKERDLGAFIPTSYAQCPWHFQSVLHKGDVGKPLGKDAELAAGRWGRRLKWQGLGGSGRDAGDAVLGWRRGGTCFVPKRHCPSQEYKGVTAASPVSVRACQLQHLLALADIYLYAVICTRLSQGRL